MLTALVFAVVVAAGDKPAYYNLPRAGVRRIQCDVNPDWEPMIADLRNQSTDAADTALRILKQFRFVWTVEPEGSTILHNDVKVENAQMRVEIVRTVDEFVGMVSGFTDIWKRFAFGAVSPTAGTRWTVDAAGTHAEIRPRFTSTPAGLLMTGYDAASVAVATNETTDVRASIAYQSIRGARVPAQLDLQGASPGGPFHIRAAFTACGI